MYAIAVNRIDVREKIQLMTKQQQQQHHFTHFEFSRNLCKTEQKSRKKQSLTWKSK